MKAAGTPSEVPLFVAGRGVPWWYREVPECSWGISGVALASLGVPGESLHVSVDILWDLWEASGVLCGPWEVIGVCGVT